ncbi:DNA polymerase III subunit gamma/tau [Urechidicola vernalis]|uniref:DNA polymerase III subunit gamma/tau n=1 Tax=Urechidicola vernalis TaxID=3075600 RepID=A0ABU2Y2E2_9FLAO|nr:DNA polymerase III subunit gamma/tau [Urechidicola sp. P050]MDT0551867.1 DNA polymerase III subunit gamma/tau [Urechidicola sp. P050]
MEHFIVSARKYRPQTFKEVVGQQAITNTLENAIKNNHLAQALLFTGPRGVGKTTCARILAKRINQDGLDKVNPDEDFAFNIFELDAASNNSVDDIRNLTDQVRIPPQVGKYKVYIIDEVHMLSQAAFNAFLKTLEEPPAHAIFILATTEKHKIIPTILSRCQIFDFKRITVFDAKNYLKEIATQENVNAEDDALHIIAQKADGAMRDALSIFDRVVSFSGAELTRQAVTENLNVLDYEVYFDMTQLLLENKIPEVLLQFNTILTKGFDAHHFIAGLASHFRDLLVAKDKVTIELLEVGDNAKKRYLEQSQAATMQFLLKAIDKANDCDFKYKTSKNQRLLVELTLMQLASITFDGEKKNDKNFIIPSNFFKATIIKERIDVAQETIAKSDTITKNYEQPSKPKIQPVVLEAAAKIKTKRKTSSTLSLKSIARKKIEDTEVVFEDFTNMPRGEFTEIEFIKLWKRHYNDLLKDGKKIIASIINADKPVLSGTIIKLTLPNENMKSQLMTHKPKLLKFLRQGLNNYGLELEIEVNEVADKKYAYTPQEKYAKLAEKNPFLSEFRKKLDLDV